MTTGCYCSTPGCTDLTYESGGQCARCQIAATPSTTARLVKQIRHSVLDGPETRWDHSGAAWRENKEAGS
jgi:hypothetical protein